ncbi:hypothetical protein BKA70DRAFT_1452079 [Coprinopsis sp. MPI-PUGE-AT-0042]|nr:hypothetical protein BKA70DRAFT_1452079 [Coprinopsis sp. MPI-PUGE-AT-0042]
MSYEPLQKLLQDHRTKARSSTGQATTEGSAIMAEIIALDTKNYNGLLIISALRVTDCILCLLHFFSDMTHLEKATYQDLCQQELAICLWFYGIYMARNPHGTSVAKELAIILRSLTDLAAKRSWDIRTLRAAVSFVEPEALSPDSSPFPVVARSPTWWRFPGQVEAPGSPSVVFTSWRTWSAHEYDENIEGNIAEINRILQQDCQAPELGQLFEDLKDNVLKHDGLVWALSARYPDWNLQPFDAKIVEDLKHRANIPDSDDLCRDRGEAQDSTRRGIDPLCPVTNALLGKLIAAKERIEKDPGVTQGLQAEAAMDKEARADMYCRLGDCLVEINECLYALHLRYPAGGYKPCLPDII